MKVNQLLLTIILCFVAIPSVWAQKTLDVKDISQPTDVYVCQDRKEMQAVFKCNKKMHLTFSTNYHVGNNVDILSLTEDSIGNERIYKLVFPTESTQKGTAGPSKRILTIYADGFNPVKLTKFNFPAKTCVTYMVEDPYTKLENPYFSAINDGADYFAKGNYSEALSNYNLAKNTPEYERDEEIREFIDGRIAVIDSINVWNTLANDEYQKKHYNEAIELYNKVVNANPSDENANKQRNNCRGELYENCTIWYNIGTELMENDHLSEAKEYYQKIIDAKGHNSIMAQDQIKTLNKMISDRKTRSHFLCYDYSKNTPIGLSVGKYNPRGWGGYFTIHLNTELFDALRDKHDLNSKPEGNISFGWTHKVVWPAWIHFGVGYTGTGTYTPKEDVAAPTDGKWTKENSTLNWYNAISPEIGVGVKIWYVTVRYTFQYRFALSNQKEYENVLGKTANFFSIGICY